MKTLRGSHSEVTGAETGASFIKRSQVNTGTTLILAAWITTSDHGLAGLVISRSDQDGAEPL
ncbi:hypothetical protein GCM10009720_17960 [Yaniella flava]|uniref:Uncharacterized protein n=1 Tax=Yaniella flava TaxID=287930 RepID=A0ABP5G0I7_9MICC